MTNSSFKFYSNFLKAIEMLPENERAEACYEFCKFGITGELPKNKSVAMFCVGVSVSVQKYQGSGGARKGAGRPKKDNKNNNIKSEYQKNQNIQKNQNNQNEQTETKTETKTKTETEIKKETSKEKNLLLPEEERPKVDYHALFNEFWTFYTPIRCNGRVVDKGSKKLTEEKFIKLLKEGEDYEKIIRGLQRYLNHCRENNQLTCQAPVFLNQRRWENEYIAVDATPAGDERQGNNSLLAPYFELLSDYYAKNGNY